MIKSGNTPVFDPERLRAISDAARAQGEVDSSKLEPTSPTTTGGIDVTMPPLEGPDPDYVTGLVRRIGETFGDDPAVMEKMGPQIAAVEAGRLATARGSDRQKPVLHTMFRPATSPTSGTVTPTKPRTMRTRHAGTLPPAGTRLDVPGHTRSMPSRVSRKVGTLLRSIYHRNNKSL